MKFTNRFAATLALLLACLLGLASAAQAQRRRAANAQRRQAAAPNRQEAARQDSVPRSLGAIRTRAEFDSLARVYHDTPYALPHLMFVIDRKERNRVYYVNSKRYRFHKDFVNGTYLSLERGREFFVNNYLNPNRRFILGTIA
ncbi:MAG TPA: hypothetical protein VE360_02045, partial [Pyrinomonadaceae bacterium]|nr:hypothetical protein [Pyrinomonadaceae bacterium]